MKVRWWEKNENLVIIGALGAGLTYSFPSHTVAFNVGGFITAVAGFLLAKSGVSDAKKYGTPSGIGSVISKGIKTFIKPKGK